MADPQQNGDNLVNVQVDGNWIKVPKGTRMIEACKQAEAEVPHYCYHPKLTSPGNCRMCLVEMERAPNSFSGTSGVVRFDRPVAEVLETVMEEGLEHHYAFAYGDHRPGLRAVAARLGVPVLELC